MITKLGHDNAVGEAKVEFESQPLVEVAAFLAFASEIPLDLFSLASWARALESEFPTVLGYLAQQSVPTGGFSFRVGQEPGIVVSGGEGFTLTLEARGLTGRWLKGRQEDEYPRFPRLLRALESGYRALPEETGIELGTLTYVNRITEESGPARELLDRSVWSGRGEAVQTEAVYVIEGGFEFRVQADAASTDSVLITNGAVRPQSDWREELRALNRAMNREFLDILTVEAKERWRLRTH